MYDCIGKFKNLFACCSTAVYNHKSLVLIYSHMFVRCLFPAALFNKPTGRKFYISTSKGILRHSRIGSQKLFSCFLLYNGIHKETAGTSNLRRKRQLGISDFTDSLTDIGKSCPAQFIYLFVEISV